MDSRELARFGAIPPSKTNESAQVMLEALLAPDQRLREIVPQVYSALSAEDEGAPYDVYAAAYDRAVSTPMYLKLAWGIRRKNNADFVRRAFESTQDGWLLDVAAGSCVDSAALYAETRRPTIVLDRSLQMLRRGAARVEEIAGRIPPNIFFLQADANDLPVRARCLTTILCHGAYHVFSDTGGITREWRRALADGGEVFVSSLVRGRWFGDRYLSLLARSGEIARPRTVADFEAALAGDLDGSVEVESIGNFAYARGTCAP